MDIQGIYLYKQHVLLTTITNSTTISNSWHHTWSYRILLAIISTSSTAKYCYTKYFWRCQIEPRAAPRAIRNLPSEQSLVPVAKKYQWESF